MIKIALDPGHGNRNSITGALDCGAVGMADGKVVRKESEHQLLFAARIKELLLARPDVKVVLLRTANDDKDIGYKCNLDYRIRLANTEGCDAYVSLHENSSASGTAQGYEIYVQTKPTSKDTALATAIYNSVVGCVPSMATSEFTALETQSKSTDKIVKRGIKKKDFKVCVRPHMPSCLVETLFVNNAADRAIFDANYEQLALATAKGILAGVGIAWSENVPDNSDDGVDYKALYLSLKGKMLAFIESIEGIKNT